MKTITVAVIFGTVVGLLWWNTANGIPNCNAEGFNANLACAPFGAEEGWYSYCYVLNGGWIASPYRCGLIDPNNSTAGYKQFNTTCGVPETPVECPPPNTTTVKALF